MMRSLASLCFCLIALLASALVRAQEIRPFVLGVAPHSSARVILEMYQPLRQHLETALKQPVEVQTATDFTEFGKRALAQEYDLAVTTGHQARVYQTDAAYLPLVTYKADFRAVVVVDRRSRHQSASDLRQTRVLGLSPSSLVSLWGLHWLKEKGIAAQVEVDFVSAADSVARQVLSGQSSAGFMSLANYQKLQPEQREQLRILAESQPLTGRSYMLNKRWSREAARIEKAILDFGATPAGRQYLEQNKLEGYRALRGKELEGMEPYAVETRQILLAR